VEIQILKNYSVCVCVVGRGGRRTAFFGSGHFIIVVNLQIQ